MASLSRVLAPVARASRRAVVPLGAAIVLAAAARGASSGRAGAVPPPCPGAEVCVDLEARRAACESGPASACDAFATAFRRLLAPCTSDQGGRTGLGYGFHACEEASYGAALATLARAAERGPGRARDLFQSGEFRDALSGESADVYVPWSLNRARASSGLPPVDWEEDVVVVSAAASSTLAPQAGNRYDPGLAVDASNETAWCEGAPGDGVGEWIEVRYQRPGGSATPLCVVRLAPGYAKSRAAYEANGRVARLRVATCSRPEAHVDVDVPQTERWPPLVDLAIPAGVVGEGTDCLRFTILGALRGNHPDTCISRIIPHLCEAPSKP